MTSRPLIFCAIDTPDLNRACELARSIGPVTGAIKLGLEFFSTFGPQGVERVREACPEAQLFLDMKYHDIPNTVAAAVKTVSENLAPAFLNVHASGGLRMMEMAKQVCSPKTKLLAVTILTSFEDSELAEIGYSDGSAGLVARMSQLTRTAKLDGVVCSAHEIEIVRKACGTDFILMVPGIRPSGSDVGDQKRVMGPCEALQKGASHLVIGRPITGAPDPAEAARVIVQDIQ